MPYDLSIHENKRYMYIRIHGELTQSDMDDAFDNILRCQSQYHLNLILCDQRSMEIPPNIMDVFSAAKRFSDQPFRGMRLAILRHVIPQEYHFFETVARNRSASVRVFDNEETAANWLVSQDN